MIIWSKKTHKCCFFGKNIFEKQNASYQNCKKWNFRYSPIKFNQIELFLGTETPVDQQLQQLFEFLNKVTSALMVRIDTEDASSAFILFESINNRGMPLTPIDLIKNSIIGHTQATPEKTNIISCFQ